MRFGIRQVFQFAINLWRARSEFLPQMFPFVKELSARLFNPTREFAPGNFGSIKLIATPLCLFGDASEVSSDCVNRSLLRTETRELRMLSVSARRALQNLLGMQTAWC